jgi:hypothetical protein
VIFEKCAKLAPATEACAIGGFNVCDAIGSGGANTLGRARGKRHFPYYFILGVGKLRLHNLLNFCKNIKELFNFTSCAQFLGIF